MFRWTTLSAAAVLALSLSPAQAQSIDLGSCKWSKGQDKMVEQGRADQARFVGASRNTDKGKGNGGEIAIHLVGDDSEDSFTFLWVTCLKTDFGEEEVNIDANDLDGYIATDPGNSNQGDGSFPILLD